MPITIYPNDVAKALKKVKEQTRFLNHVKHTDQPMRTLLILLHHIQVARKATKGSVSQLELNLG